MMILSSLMNEALCTSVYVWHFFKNKASEIMGVRWWDWFHASIKCPATFSRNACVFSPEECQPIFTVDESLSVCHLDCNLVISDVISVYLSPVAAFSNSESVSLVLLSHRMTICSLDPICPRDKQR